MVEEIQKVVREFYPEARASICGWWTSLDEVQQLQKFVSGPAKEWFSSFQFSATYDVFKLPETVGESLGGVPLSTFFHISFSHHSSDAYHSTGIHSAPSRIQLVIRSFDRAGCGGFITYNESFGDHYNACLCSWLGRNPDAGIAELAADYCRQMFGLRGQDLKDMVAILNEMEFLDMEKAGLWLSVLQCLKEKVKVPEVQSWAFNHILLKAQLMELDCRIGSGEEWNTRDDLEPLLSLIRKRMELGERLWRREYGLGVLRHVFMPEQMMPKWYEGYTRVFPVNCGKIRPGMELNENA
jgi:hypothetical protein